MKLAQYMALWPHRSQTEWAAHFGISRSYLSEIMHGRRPGAKAIDKINRATAGAVPPAVWFENEPAE